MCGIISYAGKKNAIPILIDGLERLEYRGYDSVGVAFLAKSQIYIQKKVGRIKSFKDSILDYASQNSLQSNIGIGHTRWATHGEVNLANTHPHLSNDGKIALVHNGIIENYLELKKLLEQKSFEFKSNTDTEVIPVLMESYISESYDFKDAFFKTIQNLKGSFAIACITQYDENTILVAKKQSPLVIGRNSSGYLVASDPMAISKKCSEFLFLDDFQIAFISPSKIELYNINKEKIPPKFKKAKFKIRDNDVNQFESYMLKEINEQPSVIKDIISHYIDNTSIKDNLVAPDLLKNVDKIYFVACGSSYNAGLVGKYWIEKFARIPVFIEFASEFIVRDPIVDRNTLVIGISQSGETADTLRALEYAQSRQCKILTICNVDGSSINRLSRNSILMMAGIEVGVAATKTFTAQLVILFLLALKFAVNNNVSLNTSKLINELQRLPEKVADILKNQDLIEKLSSQYFEYNNFLFLGRGLNYPIALEGALKLKEISYIHAEGIPGGEMKHGTIALIDQNFPAIVIATKDKNFSKIISNAQEIKARKGRVILVTDSSDDLGGFEEILTLPKIKNELSPILVTVALQLFVYFVSKKLGRDIDKPRNLAKSVTVE